MSVLRYARHPSRRMERLLQPPPLLQPLPYTPVILLGVLMVAGWLTLGEQPEQEIAAPSFHICAAPPHVDCVMDGDTFYLNGQSIRIADIDAPETHPSRCAHEAEVGSRATRRLRELLSGQPFEIRSYERDQDMHGRKLRIITRGGRSIGDMLVAEGLAREWTGRRQPWCG